MTAFERWTTTGLPENPPAWLFRVAQNNLLETLRRGAVERRIVRQVRIEQSLFGETALDVALSSDSVDENLLRMLFLCCDESIPVESQVVFALKTLCGFDVREIALRLFASEANVYKRFSRARSRLRELSWSPADFADTLHDSKLPAVHKTLYLLFTEGYLSSQPKTAIRRELCEEAIRLGTLLVQHLLAARQKLTPNLHSCIYIQRE
jgi:RNA polymerase sigma-70 factor (ECF subfamily)